MKDVHHTLFSGCHFHRLEKNALAIEYGAEGAVRWFPMGKRKTILLDPALQFGTPIVAHAGIPTDTIYSSYIAEGRDQEMVARVFDITPKMVIDAVEFEERLAA